MIRKYHNHTLQINSWHRDEESQNTRHQKTIKVKQPAISSPSRCTTNISVLLGEISEHESLVLIAYTNIESFSSRAFTDCTHKELKTSSQTAYNVGSPSARQRNAIDWRLAGFDGGPLLDVYWE